MRALILAAGYGTRLGNLTREIPKPLLPIAGKPMIHHTLSYLKEYGIHDIAVNLHFRPELVRDSLGTGDQFGVRITYSHERELLGTAGAVRNLSSFLCEEESFLVIYGDLLIDQPLEGMIAQHDESHADVTLLLHQRKHSNSLVQMDAERRVTAFLERPTERQRAENPLPWVNSGLQILRRHVVDWIPGDIASDLPRDIYAPRVDAARIFGFPLSGYRCAIDSPERYEQAKADVADGRYQFPSMEG